jgi:hypothetical protein
MFAGATMVCAFCGMLKSDFNFAEQLPTVGQLALDHP